MAVWLNEDFENFMALHDPEEMNRAGLQKQVDDYFEGQVAGILFCVNAQRAYFDSKVWEPAWSGVTQNSNGVWVHRGVPVKDSPLPTLRNTLGAKALHEAEENPFQIRIDQCRKNGGKGGLSIRFNDCHLPDDPDSPMHSSFWAEHPEWRLEDGGMDLGVPEVRERLMLLAEEVLARFDLDALELDWMRTPPFFRDGAEEAGRPLLDAMVKRIHEARLRAEKRLGHKVLLAARVPSRPEESLQMGLDVIRWAGEGWIDWVIPCCFIISVDSMIPQEVWRSLLPGNTMLTPGIDIVTRSIFSFTDRSPQVTRPMHNTAEMVNGHAAGFYYRGARDVYLFNHMDRNTGLRDKAACREMMKHLGSRADVEPRSRRHVATAYNNLVPGNPTVSPLPLTVSLIRQKVRLEVGSGFQGRKQTALFAFRAKGAFAPETLEFTVNEAVCPVIAAETAFQLPDPDWEIAVCRIPEGTLREGSAVLGIRALVPVDAELQWCEIDVEQ